MSLETVATKPALQLSDPIPTSDISPIPSPGMSFSHNCFENHLSREDVMSLETPANRARPSTFRANPSTFRDWDDLMLDRFILHHLSEIVLSLMGI